MADLVVLDFDGVETVDAMLTRLRALKKRELIDLLDAVVVVHPEEGEVPIKQSVHLTALGGNMSDYGINEGFIKDLGQTIKPGTSALFLLVAKATPDKVIAETKEFAPRVLDTSLSQEQEDRLREAIAAQVGA